MLVNLRFPSGGESSGSLARAFAAGTCCIVSDTAAYAELPRDAVLHLPLTGGAGLLAEALRALAAVPARAAAIGELGRRHAVAEMALPGIAARYRDVIEDSLARPVRAPPPAARSDRWWSRRGPGLQARASRRRAGRTARRLPAAARGARPGGAGRPPLDRPGLLGDLLPLAARLPRRAGGGGARPGLLLDLDLGGAA